MADSVAQHVLQCHECQLAKRMNRPQGPATIPGMGSYPFQTLVVDVVEFDEDKCKTHGMPKLLVWMDPLSRWVEAVPLKKDPTSAELLDMFMTFVVSRHGFPQSVRSDRGSYLVRSMSVILM